ncbi:hypothetical protein [Kineococcus sp. SYSU DK005]|uniref:hypothetical protein n=1 Tax=Kineococcus sp. SYSU DK005 TaxID=3383126 RepID=UPI003D7CD6BD
MSPHDPRTPSGPTPEHEEHDPTAQRLRHALSRAGRDVHAPAGITAAALRAGHRRRRQRRAALAAPLALLALVGGVGAATGWRPSTDPVRTVPAVEQVREGERAAQSIDGVLAQLAPENDWPLHPETAEVMLIDRCMAQQGLNVQRAPLAPASSLQQAIDRGGELPFLQAWAAHGSDYGMAGSIRQALQQPPTGVLGEFVHGTPDGYEEALNGDPAQELTLPTGNGGRLTVVTTGCTGQAVQELYGVGVEQYQRTYLPVRALPEQLQESLAEAAQDDERLRNAVRAWSQCMDARGHEVDTPADLPLRLQEQRRDVLLDKADGTGATAADLDAFAAFEASLAQADRACKDTSDLTPVFAEVLTRSWERLAGQHAAELAAYRALLEHARTVVDQLATGTAARSGGSSERSTGDGAR